jgi:hypothetical protein
MSFKIYLGIFFILGLSFAGYWQFVQAQSYTVDIFAIVPGCGNGFIESTEECDGVNLGGSSCAALGFDSGTVTCSSVCTLVTTSCLLKTQSSSNATRLSGKTRDVPATNIIVAGLAAPQMSITLLKDGQRVGSGVVKPNGEFQITVSGMASGMYTMQVVGETVTGEYIRSKTFPIRVVADSTTKVSYVYLPAIGSVSETDVEYVVRGMSLPLSTVTIWQGDTALPYSASVGIDGMYEIRIPKTVFPAPTTVTIMTERDTIKTTSESFVIATKEEAPVTAADDCSLPFDITGDCRANVIDFVIARSWFLKQVQDDSFDYNKDGKLDLVDFSIMAFHWTG